MTIEPQPQPEEPIDVGDLSAGGGGKAKPFGGLKLRGPTSWNPRNVTVVRTKHAWPKNQSYQPPTGASEDTASWMRLEVPAGETASVFQHPAQSNQSNPLNANLELEDLDEYTGFIVYEGHIAAHTNLTDHSKVIYPVTNTVIAHFDSSTWPAKAAGEAYRQMVCSSDDGENWTLVAP